LVHIHTTAERKGAAVKLLNLTKRIHDVLQITRLSSVFGIYSDLQKAIESFEGGG
ncbi:MAG: anti-sigma factor antagonist, partial [Acidobacteria bacterium]|nr:anti-sigma factor antagonist [Acidobacteriota bacterium]